MAIIAIGKKINGKAVIIKSLGGKDEKDEKEINIVTDSDSYLYMYGRMHC